MAQRYGLFDSTEIVETIDGYPQGNRAETADFFAKYFSNFIDNGVFTEVSTSFQVLTAGGMNVTVKKGSCFINGYMAFDDEDEVFTLTAGHTHWFVQRAHLITGGDITKTWVVDAAEGELPLRDGAYYDLLIAKVVIPTGTTEITDNMITDYRYDKTVCGAVTSLKPAVVPTLPDDVLKYVSKTMFRTAGGIPVDVGNAKIETGSYVGTGTASQALSIGFEPKVLFVGSSSSPDRYPTAAPFPAINYYHLVVIGNIGFAMARYAAYNTANSSSAIAVDVIIETNYSDKQLSLTFNNVVNPANGKMYNISDSDLTTRAPYFLGNTKGEAYYYIAIG